MKKKVLLISFDFPPRKGIGGNRIFGLAKYLPEFGFEPIVLTAKLPAEPSANCTVVESNFRDKIQKIKGFLRYNVETSIYEENPLLNYLDNTNSTLRKAINFLKWILLFPDRYSSWYKYASKDIDSLLTKYDFCAVISSLNPITSHRLAKYVKTKKNIFWIADYRDLWSNNYYLDAFNFQRKLMRLYEQKVISTADILVTVSEPLAKQLSELHGKQTKAIITGFDGSVETLEPDGSFTILYSGQLLKGKRDPSQLFKAIKEVIDENLIPQNDIRVCFYGPYSSWLDSLIISFSLASIVTQFGYIPKNEVNIKQKQAQVLLLLNWDNEKDLGNFTGKIFEYLSAKRPIISIGREDSVVTRLINETQTGIATNDHLILKAYLIRAYNEFKKHGNVLYEPNKNLMNYTQKNMAEQFASILNKYS